MTLVTFKGLLDRYGSDLRRWPAQDWADAARLLSSEPEARRLLEQSLRFDHLLQRNLETQGENEIPDAAMSRLLERLQTLPRQEPARQTSPARPRFSGIAKDWPRVAALSFAAAIGIAIGFISADWHALEDKRRISMAMDDLEPDLNPALFDTDSTMGAPR